MASAGSIGAGLIDMRHSGLRCRADASCRLSFQTPSNVLVTIAAGLRDAHELTHGGYVHPLPPEPKKWGFLAMREQRTR